EVGYQRHFVPASRLGRWRTRLREGDGEENAAGEKFSDPLSPDHTATAIGLGSLPNRALTGQHVISSDGYGANSALSRVGLADSSSIAPARNTSAAVRLTKNQGGTDGSNPVPSSGESANHRFLSSSVRWRPAEEAAPHGPKRGSSCEIAGP